MATSEGPRRRSKTRDSIVEAFKKISEVVDEEAREDEAELEQLRMRSAKVDDLQQENDRLRKELEIVLKDLDERKFKERVIPPSDIDSSEEYSPESKKPGSTSKYSQKEQDLEAIRKPSMRELSRDLEFRDVAVQTLQPESLEEEFPAKAPPTWSDEELVKRYNDLASNSHTLKKNHTGVLEARQKLEDRVRQLLSDRQEFIRYTHWLNKKKKKLEAELTKCPNDHHEVLNSSSPWRGRNLAGQPDSDDEMLLGPPTTHNELTSTPLLSNPRHELQPLALLPASSPTKPSSRPNRPSPQAVPRNEAQTDPFAMPDDQVPPGDPHQDAILTNGETLPLVSDEADQELPKLKDGSANSTTQHSNRTSSTQGEPYTMQQDALNTHSPAIKSEGDSPVLVRMQRVQKTRLRRTNASSAVISRAVKAEEISSSPVGLAPMDYGGSIDLDDHPHMITPRKRKTPVTSNGTSPSRLSSLNEPDEGIISKSIQALRSSAILVERSPDKPTMNPNALQPKSSNKQPFRRIEDGQPPHKRQRRHVSPTAIASLAEDGENFEAVPRETRGPKNRNSGFLSELLIRPPSRSSVISPRTTPGTAKSASRRTLAPGTSPPPSRPSSRAGSKSRTGPSNSLATSRISRVQAQPKIASSGDIYEIPSSSPTHEEQVKTSKISKSSKKKPPHRRADGPVDDHPDHEPLRCKPVNYLTLDDFKINPGYNQGYNHAFQEVVRKKDERRCLPGCERSCCGPQFRKLAEMTISARIGPPSESIQESDKRALMNYLGDDFPKYSRLSAEKKKEILILAMARQLATDHGKHRHAYPRRDSPPGFWDVDFPETQEAAANRAAALQAERLRVEERYREAMRPGGAYMFRDE